MSLRKKQLAIGNKQWANAANNQNFYMKLLYATFLLLFSFNLFAQSGTRPIDSLLKAIRNYREFESKTDSVLGRPFGSLKEADIYRDYRFFDSINTELNKIDTAKLNFNERINLDLVKYSIEDDIYSYTYKAYLNPILADEGFHTRLAAMGSQLMSTKTEYQNYLQRLKDMPRFVQENLDLMRKGLELGISQPRAILNGYENTYVQHIVDTVEKSVFWRPFSRKPVSISNEDWDKLSAEARLVIMRDAVGAYKSIKTFFEKEYLPRTRTTIGVSNFPNGIAYYRELVKHYTTTNLSYEEIYQVGLKEVERIKTEMNKVLVQVGFKGSLKEFIDWLRTEPRFYANTPEELLKEASFIAKKADGKLPQFFGQTTASTLWC